MMFSDRGRRSQSGVSQSQTLVIVAVVMVAAFGAIVAVAWFTSGETLVGGNRCEVDCDCRVFGETGDCNCGCYNKDFQWKPEGECFCQAPDACKCIDGLCVGVFQGNLDQSCMISGGVVRTGLCCKSVDDFPNTCKVGACGCAPEHSHEVKICDCGECKCFDGETCVPVVGSFQDCVDAGYPVMESYPRQCRTPDGRTFTEGNMVCIAPTGEIMKLFKAMIICKDSGCCNQIKEPYERNSMCNADTGTWWIDLDIEKPGCSPACVVDIVTEEAEINWRCTGD